MLTRGNFFPNIDKLQLVESDVEPEDMEGQLQPLKGNLLCYLSQEGNGK